MCVVEGLKTRVQLPPRPPKFELPKKKYDESDLERRRSQKRDYMRRKRREDPNYCKWK